MNDLQEQINNIRIATPCSADWDSMDGDERKRFCQACKLNVYNVAELSPKEVGDLLSTSRGGRVCMQIYRRRDGTVITRDCPVAVQRVKKAFKRGVAAIAGLGTMVGLALPAAAQNSPGAKGEVEAYPMRGKVVAQPELGDAVNPSELGGYTQAPPYEPSEDGSNTLDTAAIESPSPRMPDWVPWLAASAIGAALLVLLRKRASMWIIGFTLGGLFATLGYLWSVAM